MTGAEARPTTDLTTRAEVTAVDILIAGDVVRVILSGAPALDAETLDDALTELRGKHEPFREFIMQHPRGHDGIVDSAILLPPVSKTAARSILIGTQEGYGSLAGTPMLASVCALVETGRVPVQEPETSVTFDTARGPAEVRAVIRGGRCVSAAWHTQLPKVVAQDRIVEMESGACVPVTILDAGLPFLVADVTGCGASMEDIESLGTAGASLSKAAGQQVPLCDFGLEHSFPNYLVMLVEPVVKAPGDNQAQIMVGCVMPDGSVSRMPSGLGTLSVAATLAAQGLLDVGNLLCVRTPMGFELSCQTCDHGALLEGQTRLISALQLLED